MNEAEETLSPFLRDLAQGQARRVYDSTEFPEIHQTPVPLWQMADLSQYDTVPIQFSRACPFNCDFCNVTAMVGLLQAPLGTRLNDRMQKEGRLVNEFSGDNVDGSTNIIPRMRLETLRNGYREILSYIYAPKFYYARIMTFLREYQPPKIKVHLEPQYIMALWRSIYQLGIRGIERVHYWRLFFWTLFRCPRLFPLAITCAIHGFHFRQVAELHIE